MRLEPVYVGKAIRWPVVGLWHVYPSARKAARQEARRVAARRPHVHAATEKRDGITGLLLCACGAQVKVY